MYILKVEPIELADRLGQDVACEKEVTRMTEVLDLCNWKDGVALN